MLAEINSSWIYNLENLEQLALDKINRKKG